MDSQRCVGGPDESVLLCVADGLAPATNVGAAKDFLTARLCRRVQAAFGGKKNKK